MHYKSNNHSVILGTELNLSPQTRIYTNFTLNRSDSALGTLALNMSDVYKDPVTGATVTPAGYSYTNVSDLSTFSDLKLRRFIQTVGVEHRIANRFLLNQEAWFHDYKDGDPYLFDSNGRNLGFRVALNYLF